MKKKQYMKPTCKVYEMKSQQQLLVGSYPGEIHFPGLPTGGKHLS